MDLGMRTPRLAASTGKLYSRSIAESKLLEEIHALPNNEYTNRLYNEKRGVLDPKSETNYFKSAQWSPDGTSIFTNSADNIIRTFLAPTELLSDHSEPMELLSYTSLECPEPVYALAPYPYFDLQDSSTTLHLTSIRDHPTRLTNVLDPASKMIATYPLVSPTTESYQTPSSLIFTPKGTSFLTGTSCLISLFDLSRSGEGPVARLPTIPSKRHKMKGGGVGMRGVVSALSMQPASHDGSPMLAAGTWTRSVGLYDAEGMGGTVATWSVEKAADTEAEIAGAGVSQVLWSHCGRYLFVVERMSKGVLIYDVRVTGKLVGWLDGRAAETNQRLAVEVFDGGEHGCEIWAGGTDGIVKIWTEVGSTEGRVEGSWQWRAHDSAVTSIGMHPSGTVVLTGSGQRMDFSVESDEGSDDSDIGDSEQEYDGEISNFPSAVASKSHPRCDGRLADNSVKLWSLL